MGGTAGEEHEAGKAYQENGTNHYPPSFDVMRFDKIPSYRWSFKEKIKRRKTKKM
jgi:hypothetical protein